MNRIAKMMSSCEAEALSSHAADRRIAIPMVIIATRGRCWFKGAEMRRAGITTMTSKTQTFDCKELEDAEYD